MAKMCPPCRCRSCEGLCGHDKMMLGTGVPMMIAAVAHRVLHWG